MRFRSAHATLPLPSSHRLAAFRLSDNSICAVQPLGNVTWTILLVALNWRHRFRSLLRNGTFMRMSSKIEGLSMDLEKNSSCKCQEREARGSFWQLDEQMQSKLTGSRIDEVFLSYAVYADVVLATGPGGPNLFQGFGRPASPTHQKSHQRGSRRFLQDIPHDPKASLDELCMTQIYESRFETPFGQYGICFYVFQPASASIWMEQFQQSLVQSSVFCHSLQR